MKWKNALVIVILLILSIPLFRINVHAVHGWGDDFAQYIQEAKSISEGRPYYDTKYVFNHYNAEYGPPQYPMGFPLILAPIVKVFGAFNFYKMAQLIALCLTALMIILYFYFRKYMTTISAICMAVLCVYAGSVLEQKGQILSDLPCWTFIALYLTLRSADKSSIGRIVLLVLSALMAILTRSQSLLLLAAEGLYLLSSTAQVLYRERKFDFRQVLQSVSFKVIVATFILFLLIDKVIFHPPVSTTGFYQELFSYHNMPFWDAIGENMNFMLDRYVRIMHYYPKEGVAFAFARFFVMAIFGFSFIGLLKFLKKGPRVDDWYYLLLVIVLLFLQQKQGVRLIFSIIPIYMLYALTAGRDVLSSFYIRRYGYILTVIFTVAYLYIGADDFDHFKETPGDAMPLDKDMQAFQYIRDHVSKDDTILFSKPRALGLFTDIPSTPLAWQVSPEENKKFFDSIGVKYILINEALQDGGLVSYLHSMEHPIDSAHIAEGYTLYTIR